MSRHPTKRERLIANGYIVPKSARVHIPRKVLRMDDAGKRAAVRHQEEYWQDPWAFSSRRFWWPTPEEWFDESSTHPTEVH